MGVDDQAIKRVENAVQIVRNSPAANRYCQLPKEGAVYENDGLSPLKSPLGLRSTPQELTLYDFFLESECPGDEVAKNFSGKPFTSRDHHHSGRKVYRDDFAAAFF